jgi:phosphoserine phosphatase RsbU/P
MTLTTLKPEILLIDDSEEIGETLSFLLKNLGYSARYFSNPLEAISYFESELNPIVLLDINLPGKNGLELLPLFKKINPKTQVIMITGERDINAVMYCLANRASDFILKPFSLDTVEKTLERVLEYYNLLKERENYQEALERDVRFTSRIQRQIIFPSKLEKDLYIDYFPVNSVSGNFYHIIKIGDQKEMILFGNVEGVGVASGFVALYAVSLVKDIIKTNQSPAEVLKFVNNELYFKLNVHTLALACIVLDQKKHKIHYSLGGTPDPILFTDLSLEIQYLKAEETSILGIVPNAEFKNYELVYKPNDILFICNEGFFNSSNADYYNEYLKFMSKMFDTFQNTNDTRFDDMKTNLEEFLKIVRKNIIGRKDRAFLFLRLK